LLEESLRFEALRTFEPLFTTKAEGLDICLAVVRTIVDAHGGGLGAANN
jgi:nitrogen fixation/metabolism regulation signal transduction histidine kinase